MLCNNHTTGKNQIIAAICLTFVVGLLVFLIQTPFVDDKSLGEKQKMISIQWRYDGMRGGLKLGSYNTVYYIDNIEVGVDKEGLDRIMECVDSTRNTEIRIYAYPTVNVGPIEKMPEMLSNEIPKIMNIARRRSGSAIVIKTKDHIRDELPFEFQVKSRANQ